MKKVFKKLSEYPAIPGFNSVASALFKENNLDINSEADIEKYLPDQFHQYSSFCEFLESSEKLKGTDEFVSKIKEFPLDKKILIYADFDGDGITSAIILSLTFDILGRTNSFYIPDRINEGYGLRDESVLNILSEESKPDVVITVDNGIASGSAVKILQENNVEVIITDHHIPGENLPNNCLIVDPKYNNDSFSDICGAFVALKLSYALLKELAPNQLYRLEEFAPLAGIATITDMMPLLKENRPLVVLSLRAIENSKYEETSVLKKILFSYGAGNFYKYNNRIATEELISFYIGPALNAVSRVHGSVLDTVSKILSIFRRETFYLPIDKSNVIRQGMTFDLEERISSFKDDIYNESENSIIICRLPEDKKDDFITTPESSMAYKGVFGIIANQLCSKTKKVSIVGLMKDEENHIYDFSCRSPQGYNLNEGIERLKLAHPELELAGGGHAMAMGLRTKITCRKDLQKFQNLLDEDIKNHLEDYNETFFEWEPELEEDIIKTLQALQPFGKSFETLKFHFVGKYNGYDRKTKLATYGNMQFKQYKDISDINNQDVFFTISLSNAAGPEYLILKD